MALFSKWLREASKMAARKIKVFDQRINVVATFVAAIAMVVGYPALGAADYDESADGAIQISNAVTEAANGKKHVLVDFGANWCVWCRRLNALFDSDRSIKKALNTNYVVVRIDVNPRNEHLLTKYEAVRYGLPVVAILNSSGGRLVTQNTEDFEEGGNGHNPQKVLSFLNKWTPQAVVSNEVALRNKSGEQWVKELTAAPDSDLSIALPYLRSKFNEALPVLQDLLRTNSTTDLSLNQRKQQGYRIIASLGPSARASVPFLVEQLTTNNFIFLQNIDAALIAIGPESRVAIPTLAKIVLDPSLTATLADSDKPYAGHPGAWLSLTSAHCLAVLDPDHPILVPTATSWLTNSNVVCRRTAARILAAIGPRASACVGPLKQACFDDDAAVRRFCTNALAAVRAQ
jgi:hypothetical protein